MLLTVKRDRKGLQYVSKLFSDTVVLILTSFRGPRQVICRFFDLSTANCKKGVQGPTVSRAWLLKLFPIPANLYKGPSGAQDE